MLNASFSFLNTSLLLGIKLKVGSNDKCLLSSGRIENSSINLPSYLSRHYPANNPLMANYLGIHGAFHCMGGGRLLDCIPIVKSYVIFT